MGDVGLVVGHLAFALAHHRKVMAANSLADVLDARTRTVAVVGADAVDCRRGDHSVSVLAWVLIALGLVVGVIVVLQLLGVVTWPARWLGHRRHQR